MTPKELSEQLRKGQSDDLTRRRWIVGLSLVGATMGKIVSLYQTGIIKTLPDPPIPLFDSAKVDASDYAYRRLNSPDAPMMMTNYGVTTALAATGGINRAEEQPFLPILLAAKTFGDTLTALELSREEWAENKALCFYCQIALVASAASAVLAIPEAMKAVKHLTNSSPKTAEA